MALQDVIYISGGPASGGNAHLSQYSLDGVLLGRIEGQGIDGTGGAVDPDTGNPYWTNFLGNRVETVPKDPVNKVLGPLSMYLSSTRANPESFVFRGDKAYVGYAGANVITRHDKKTGVLEKSWQVPVSRGTDWIGLASDNKTMFYTSETGVVYRFDVEAEKQLPNFLDSTGFGANYAVFPRFGDDHVFVTGGPGVNRYDPTGKLVRQYVMQPAPFAFSAALSLDGNRLYFADYQSNNVWIVDVESGKGSEAPAFQQPGGGGYRAGGTFSLGGTQSLQVIEALERRPNFTRGRA